LIQRGTFYEIVATPDEKRGALLMRLLPQPQFREWRVGLTTWINSLSTRNRVTNRAVEEEEASSRRRRPVKQTRLPVDAVLEVVNRQKEAVLKS
jgi:hypothetical protein